MKLTLKGKIHNGKLRINRDNRKNLILVCEVTKSTTMAIGSIGSVLAEVGDLEHGSVKPPQKHHRSRNVDDTTNAPILANTCYQQPFFQLNY